MTTLHINVTATVTPSTAYLAQFDPDNHAGALSASDDWSGYSDSAALHAARTFGKGSPGQPYPAKEYMVQKINADPIFPNRMIRFFYPYNNDYVASAGESAGRAPKYEVTGLSLTNLWVCYTYRYFGTQHPQGGASGGWNQVGNHPSGADGYKILHINWPGGVYSGGRLGPNYATVSTGSMNIDNGYGGVTFDGHGISHGSLADLNSLNMVNTTGYFTGLEAFQYVIHYVKLSDTEAMHREVCQQLTNNGVWNPQPPVGFFAGRHDNPSGGVFPTVSSVTLGINKNRTTGTDGLTTTTYDNPDTFSSASGSEGTPRTPSDTDYKGTRKDVGPYLLINGSTEPRPFHDFRGTNFDDYGRSDPDFPAGY